eukprot:SAG31_NODE_5267_length_2642_cov_2.352340_3_plen_67_part_00
MHNEYINTSKQVYMSSGKGVRYVAHHLITDKNPNDGAVCDQRGKCLSLSIHRVLPTVRKLPAASSL